MLRSAFLAMLLLTLSLLIRSSTAAIPPACVLACVNEEPTPSDIRPVCGSEDAQSCLASKCGGSKQVAIDYFRSTCESAGYGVAQAVDGSDGSSNSATTSTTTGGSTATNTTNNGAKYVGFGGSLVILLFSMGFLVL